MLHLTHFLVNSSLDTNGVSDPMDFNNEFLNALAQLDGARAAPSTIKTLKSVTPSVRSPLPTEDPSAVRVILKESILISMMGIVMKSSVRRMETLLTHLARVLTARSSWCLFWESNLSHFAPKVRKSASIFSLTEDGHRANKTLLLG